MTKPTTKKFAFVLGLLVAGCTLLPLRDAESDATTTIRTNVLKGKPTLSINNNGNTLTLPTTTTTLVGHDTTNTLTNKTIDADGTGNSISNIENADIKAGAAIARTKIANGTAYGAVTNDSNGTLTSVAPGASGNVLKSDGTQWTSGTVPTGSVRVAFAYVTNNGTAAISFQSSEGSNWLTSVTRNSGGQVSGVITGGIFSSAPACTVSNQTAANVTIRMDAATTTTSWSTQTVTFAPAVSDQDFYIICAGLR